MPHPARTQHRGSAWRVFLVFLLLGCTSFGGPTAHLGYFRTEFVERRRWMSDDEFVEIVTLSQFLPGPASSQVGFGIGLHRAGFAGALAAFVGFTLPSAALLVAFAYSATSFAGDIGTGLLTGLQIVAVAIVAHAVIGMAKTLTPDAHRASIAVIAAASVLLIPGTIGQLIALTVGALAGVFLLRGIATGAAKPLRLGVSRVTGIVCLVIFVVCFVGAPLAHRLTDIELFAQFDAYYRAGSLVFGGGHVVLPLLQAGVVDAGAVTSQQFLVGYGAAQAVPGPLFTFAAYLGTLSQIGASGVLGAFIALTGIFLPGFLLFLGVIPFWSALREHAAARAMMAGMSAAVVGILGAALYTPVFTTAVTSAGPLVLAIACFVLLARWRVAPWVVVVAGAVGGIVLQAI